MDIGQTDTAWAFGSPVICAAFSPDNTKLVATLFYNYQLPQDAYPIGEVEDIPLPIKLLVYDPKTGKILRQIMFPYGGLLNLTF